MKRTTIKLLILALASVLLLALVQSAYADEQYLKNVQISSDGILSWETDLDDEEELTIGTLSPINVKGMSSISLYNQCKNKHLESGTYPVKLVVRKYIDKWEYYVTRDWEGSYTYEAPASYTITVNGGKAYKSGGVAITSAIAGDQVYILFDDNAAPAGKYIQWGSAVTDPDVSISLGMISGTEYQAGFEMPASNITVSPDYQNQQPVTVDLASGESTDAASASNAVWSLYRAKALGLITADLSSGYQEKFDLDNDGTYDVEYHSSDEKFVIEIYASDRSLAVKRSGATGKTFGNFSIPSIQAPLNVEGDHVEIDLFVDQSSVEILSKDGAMSMTNLVFPQSIYDNLTMTNSDCTAKVRSLSRIW